VLEAPGESLDGGARRFMEQRFGRSFADVRAHTTPRAADSARAVQASAYTVGRHIVFGAGAYQPHTGQGLHLIAHELAHVVQQQSGFEYTAPSSPQHEREADSAAEAALLGGRMSPLTSLNGVALQRQPAGGGGPKTPEAIPPDLVQTRQALTPQLNDLYPKGSSDAEQWSARVKAALAAPDAAPFIALYAEIAELAQASKLGPDFGTSSAAIHHARSAEKDLKPGLNFSLGHTSSNGRTSFIDANGRVTGAQLPLDGPASPIKRQPRARLQGIPREAGSPRGLASRSSSLWKRH
jgi:hypothetical protein